MDHNELKDALEKRFDKTDEKIDELRKDISEDRIRTAVLENQMSGVVKLGLIIFTAVVGIIVRIFKEGL